MKLTDCINRINQALNFPALSYEDMSHFLDQSIAELNTSLRTGIPTVTEMIETSRTDYLNSDDAIMLNDIPSQPIPTSVSDAVDAGLNYYYNSEDGKFHTITPDVAHDRLYGVYMPTFDERRVFQALVFGSENAVWAEVDLAALPDVDLAVWLPEEWVILFVIPYVCSKCSARDGGDGRQFVEEYAQGFQQLQTSYNVPNKVRLNSVAERLAYKSMVIKVLESRGPLNVLVQTHAIYPEMKINTVENAIYGGMYDNGGWGI